MKSQAQHHSGLKLDLKLKYLCENAETSNSVWVKEIDMALIWATPVNSITVRCLLTFKNKKYLK